MTLRNFQLVKEVWRARLLLAQESSEAAFLQTYEQQVAVSSGLCPGV